MDLKEEYCQDLTKLTELSAGQSLTSLVFGVQMLSKYVARLNDGNAGAAPAPKPDKPDVAAVNAPQSTAPAAQAAPTTSTEPAAPEAEAAEPAPAKPRTEIKPNVSLRTVHHPLPTVKVGAAAARATGGATEDSAPIVVERRLSGAKAGAYFLKEHLVRTMGLQNGNKVIIPDGRFADMRIFDRTAEPDGIARINNVLLEEEEDLSYPYVAYADRSYIGNPLEYEGEPIRFEFTQSDLDYVKTQLGDVVDLAWYISRGPKSARISWVHYELKPLVLKKPATPTPTPAKEKKVAEEDKPKHPTNIEFDLDGKRVLIIGFEDSLNGLRGIIEAHNGKYQCSEALQSNKLRTRVQGADLVIPVISQAHHINTNTALALAKLQGKPYAVADGSSPLSLERAIYRALHHLPAYESRGADIEYPLTEDVEISITEE
ncbi:DUF2325 domain-containing protein [Lacticaseibacillus sharpeae]|nr:DUF2325 domain-containing protein [Lacticaseibacillus sharpeae]